ncbi:PKD domain-containing protein, partial [Mesonia ostreae]
MKNIYLLLFALLSMSLFSQNVIMGDADVDQCSGVFYDNGGPGAGSGAYNDNGGVPQVITICPDQPGQVTELDFTTFLLGSTSSTEDVLNIYDGDSTGATLIGSYQGNGSPGLVFASSTNTSGCLTIEFVPDGEFSPLEGWAADIGCREPCQVITAQIDSVTPSEFNAGVYTVTFNESILFQGSGIFADGDGTGATYEWDFGDGNTGIGQDTAHTYAQIGTYDVTLIVYDQNSCPSEVLEFVVEVESNAASYCADLNPFCAGDEALVFPNSNPQTGGLPIAETGPEYDCIGQERYPAWFYLQIDDPGDLDFTLAQNTSPNFNGQGLDVDFIVWGPFTQPDGNCGNLTAGNVVDCSYSAAPIEDVSIPNAQTGEIYIIMITNYNEGVGYISLQQTGGAGNTDCSILDTTLPDDQELCEGEDYTIDGTTIGATSYQWSIYNEATDTYDPLPGETNPVITVNTTGIYQVETDDGDGDSSFDEVEIIFYDIATIETLNDLEECFTTDITTIDITQDTDILGAQEPAEFNITYYNTQAEADAGTGNIPDPANYPFIANTAETIFVRVENVNKADCYITGSFELEVNVVSIGNALTNLEECDDDNDGDGIFDLTENEVLALDVLDPASYAVTYYETQAAADLGTPEVPTPAAYENENGNPQEIFVRVESNENANCYATNSFFVESFSIGEVNPVENLDICDTTGLGVDFDLTTNTALVLGIQDPADFAVTYYNTQAEADAGTPEIADPANYEVVNEGSQTIFIRIENVNNTEC